jgi:rhodanese-related sulfurtransferase
MRRTVLMCVVAVSLAGFVPAVFEAQDVGQYASGVAPKHVEWKTPPGHFGLIAGYADDFLSKAPSNGNYMISWATLTDGVDDPEKADQLEDFLVLDIRAAAVFNSRHLTGAINVPFADVAKPWNLAELPTSQPILVVCGSGATAAQTGALLGMMGYNIRILTGGMNAVPASYAPPAG